ncbi:MAG: 50S ribosomal protein L35 [bacterium]
MKTNNSYAKRIRITKNGKILSRKAGKNHFNAKESRSTQLSSKGMATNNINNMKKAGIAKYMPHHV